MNVQDEAFKLPSRPTILTEIEVPTPETIVPTLGDCVKVTAPGQLSDVVTKLV